MLYCCLNKYETGVSRPFPRPFHLPVSLNMLSASGKGDEDSDDDGGSCYVDGTVDDESGSGDEDR